MSTQQPRSFFQSLESLRGIAALVVVLNHVGWMNPLYEIGFIRNGALMVDLFFVLSGFVIVHCYGHRFIDQGSLWAFLKARFWRLYPLHLLMLFVFLGIELIKYVAELKLGIVSGNPAFSKSNGESFFYQIFLLHSLIQDHGSFNSPSWSISTEFYTYISFAIVMAIVKTERFLSFIFITIVVLSLFIILKTGHASLTFDDQYTIFRCSYGFFIGAFVHGIYQKLSVLDQLKNNPHIGSATLLFIIILLAYVLGIKQDNFIEFFMPPLVGVLILLLTLFPENIATKTFCWPPFLWLGKVSYSIYMVHMAFIWFFSALAQAVMRIPKTTIDNGDTIVSTSMLEGTIMIFALVICVLYTSHFTYKYIEDPFRKFAKRSYMYKRSIIQNSK
ncbi:MAG: peptidoglycan/LPS O-acetylase OafA/YrhL [Oleiphilaceae bacterium]|jgi:peptidoglycan/LPS O-acetylase OafA/YrhL